MLDPNTTHPSPPLHPPPQFPVLDPRNGEEVFQVAEADMADVDK